MRWGLQKERAVRFGETFNDQTVSLGITINSKLNFQPQINKRTEKVRSLWNVMKRLGNSNGGSAPEL